MYTLRRVFAIWAALLVLAFVGRAHAQALGSTLKINKAGVVHSAARSANRLNTLINRSDCDNDDIMSFPVTLTNRGTYSLQAWVGTTNCADQTIRQSSTQQQCWKVYDAIPGGTNPNAPTLGIPVRSMVAGYTSLFGGTPASNDGGAGGAANTAGTGGDTSSAGAATGGATSNPTQPIGTLVMAGKEACTPVSTVAGATTLTVYIMLVDASTQAAAASDTWVGTFKLVGPPAPDQVSIGIGGNLLVMNFKYSSAPADQTGNGYYLYCDPPPGSAAALDAGLLEPDASAGMTLSCGVPNSQVLVPGMAAPTDGAYRCGSAAKSSETANATGLVNGVAYNVAVAAYDLYENVGPLSSLTCEVPQPVTGFFKAYRDAGGEGGGGFCSFSRHREPLTLIAVLGFASYLVLRRRRSA